MSKIVERIRERQKVQEVKQDEVRKEAVRALGGIALALIAASQPRRKKWWKF